MKRRTTRNPSDVRENLNWLVQLAMKVLLTALSTVLASITLSLAGTDKSHSPTILTEAGTPSLNLKNVRIDLRDGKIRGTAYVSFGYAAPKSAHIHAYGIDSKGAVVAEGCDSLSGNLLAPHPRLAGKGKDLFGLELKGSSEDIRTIRVVSHLGRSDCSG
ncbi:MAG: hypothetical protein NTZ94_01465 [Verrucomicrobia bacterium]|jgi:hypothetical protein|nr:hypothetical protein [Verrucomicrobiota bacterium]